MKYYLDTNTLTYKPLISTPQIMFKRISKIFLGLVVLSILSFLLLTKYGYTPHELILKKSNEKYVQEIISYSGHIQALNDTLADIEENDDVIYRPFVEIKPLPKTIREAGFGGTDRYRSFAGIPKSDDIVKVFRNLDKLNGHVQMQQKSFDDVEEMVTFIEGFYAAKPGIRPIKREDEIFISSYYGRRFHPVYKRWKTHHGVDYAASIGSPVYATGDGIVKTAHYASGYGKVVRINHGYGYESIYGHLNRFIVKRGDTLKRGQLLGYSGSTGVSTGPHLHYEIRKNNRTQNPLYFYIDDLKDEEYEVIVSK
ncbi:MAG: M23 family metallopeptidase [Salinivirgaceae bacterium]|jgi:murein DD-endopeptidase MepM/ murein hydrolase activator NlpD|nr:M23 family metallopeptidase [Salinivirgaceae bacterium]